MKSFNEKVKKKKVVSVVIHKKSSVQSNHIHLPEHYAKKKRRKNNIIKGCYNCWLLVLVVVVVVVVAVGAGKKCCSQQHRHLGRLCSGVCVHLGAFWCTLKEEKRRRREQKVHHFAAIRVGKSSAWQMEKVKCWKTVVKSVCRLWWWMTFENDFFYERGEWCESLDLSKTFKYFFCAFNFIPVLFRINLQILRIILIIIKMLFTTESFLCICWLILTDLQHLLPLSNCTNHVSNWSVFPVHITHSKKFSPPPTHSPQTHTEKHKHTLPRGQHVVVGCPANPNRKKFMACCRLSTRLFVVTTRHGLLRLCVYWCCCCCY